MANNGGGRPGGGGGGGGNGSMNEHVEFTVQAEEDLFLTGSESTIRRVTAETNYSCLMLKTQRFSSLFRHYAKYHGLRKDDLEYYFVNPLENEDTPETVQLQRGDVIKVRKRRKPIPDEAVADDEEMIRDMRELLDDQEHMDVKFQIHRNQASSAGNHNNHNSSDSMDTTTSSDHQEDGSSKSSKHDSSENFMELRAHRCVLTCRTEYFKAFFRKAGGNAFRESEECVVHVEPIFTATHIQHTLEFIYTNRIQNLKNVSTEDLLCILHLSDMWLLRDLKRLVEHQLVRYHMSVHNVARMYGATEDFKAQRLSKACINFIMDNLRQVTTNTSFAEEMKNYPHLCIPVLKAAAEVIGEGPAHKKQKFTVEHQVCAATSTPKNNVSGSAALGSSPVPDTDA